MATGPKTGWGGVRPGSGPKTKTLSASQVELMLDKAKKKAEETGKDVDDILLDFIYDADGSKKDRIACIKLWKDFSMVRISEGGDADKNLGPGIYLPGEKPDPTKVVELKQVS
jgi:hypothetical protein